MEGKLLDLLVERGLLKPEQVTHVLARVQEENKKPEEIIRQERLVFPEALAKVQAEIAGMPYADLMAMTIKEEAMRDVSRKAAATYRFAPFSIQDGKLLIAIQDPNDFSAQEAAKFIAKRRGLEPELYIASSEGIDRALGGSSAVQAEIGGALQDFSQELQEAGSEIANQGDKEIEQIVEEAPVSKVVAVIIRHAIEGNASDIHVEPSEKDVRIRYRIDGDLHTTLVLPRKIQSAIISRIKILANLKIDESRLPQDGRFSATVDNHEYDFRVSVMPITYGEKAALRILDKSSGAPSLDELGMPAPMQSLFTQGVKAPNGICLISGPTGAGKSTTLFTALTLLNSVEQNIVTLEDPVEYEISGVNQTQVKPEIGLSFASGLRSILRQDPDIIMVGEIRDKETAELAVHSSLTGHLVLSTIHTNDAIGTIPRLVDMGIDPFLLAASLRLLAAQRLVGRLCQNCKKEVPLTDTMKEDIKNELHSVPDTYLTNDNQRNPQVLYESAGCPECHEQGTVGRLAIFEMVPVSRGIRQAMNESPDYDTLESVALKEGMVTMRQDGLLKALTGAVHFEDVIRVTSEAQNPEEIQIEP